MKEIINASLFYEIIVLNLRDVYLRNASAFDLRELIPRIRTILIWEKKIVYSTLDIANRLSRGLSWVATFQARQQIRLGDDNFITLQY